MKSLLLRKAANECESFATVGYIRFGRSSRKQWMLWEVLPTGKIATADMDINPDRDGVGLTCYNEYSLAYFRHWVEEKNLTTIKVGRIVEDRNPRRKPYDAREIIRVGEYGRLYRKRRPRGLKKIDPHIFE